MKVLLAHNYYLHPGGEDQVFAAELAALRAGGHDVRVYTLNNAAISSMSTVELAASTVWNRRALRALTDLVGDDPPDIAHFHNTFPLISPAAYIALQRLGIPVVQTLHNFRLLCLNGLLLRDGRICEACVGRAVAWPGVVHRCYRTSHRASAATAAMLSFHRWRGTWATAVDTYIALSEFARSKFISGGFPADRIVVKPNFVSDDPGVGAHSGGYALYVGRLSPEKGLGFLLRLWTQVVERLPLRIIGSGPLEDQKVSAPPNVQWLGWQPHDKALAAMADAAFLVFPSECYETFGMVLIEAMATGLPVIAADRGPMAEIVHHGRTGLLVPPSDHDAWARAVHWAISNPGRLAEMGYEARREFERKYTRETGYRALAEVYQHTLERSRGVKQAAAASSGR